MMWHSVRAGLYPPIRVNCCFPFYLNLNSLYSCHTHWFPGSAWEPVDRDGRRVFS